MSGQTGYYDREQKAASHDNDYLAQVSRDIADLSESVKSVSDHLIDCGELTSTKSHSIRRESTGGDSIHMKQRHDEEYNEPELYHQRRQSKEPKRYPRSSTRRRSDRRSSLDRQPNPHPYDNQPTAPPPIFDCSASSLSSVSTSSSLSSIYSTTRNTWSQLSLQDFMQSNNNNNNRRPREIQEVNNNARELLQQQQPPSQQQQQEDASSVSSSSTSHSPLWQQLQQHQSSAAALQQQQSAQSPQRHQEDASSASSSSSTSNSAFLRMLQQEQINAAVSQQQEQHKHPQQLQEDASSTTSSRTSHSLLWQQPPEHASNTFPSTFQQQHQILQKQIIEAESQQQQQVANTKLYSKKQNSPEKDTSNASTDTTHSLSPKEKAILFVDDIVAAALSSPDSTDSTAPQSTSPSSKASSSSSSSYGISKFEEELMDIQTNTDMIAPKGSDDMVVLKPLHSGRSKTDDVVDDSKQNVETKERNVPRQEKRRRRKSKKRKQKQSKREEKRLSYLPADYVITDDRMERSLDISMKGGVVHGHNIQEEQIQFADMEQTALSENEPLEPTKKSSLSSVGSNESRDVEEFAQNFTALEQKQKQRERKDSLSLLPSADNNKQPIPQCSAYHRHSVKKQLPIITIHEEASGEFSTTDFSVEKKDFLAMEDGEARTASTALGEKSRSLSMIIDTKEDSYRSHKRPWWRQRRWGLLAVFFITLLITILAIALSNGGGNGSDDKAESAPKREVLEINTKNLIVNELPETEESLSNEELPQYQALQWVVDQQYFNDNLTEWFSDERILRQYSLATLLISTSSTEYETRQINEDFSYIDAFHDDPGQGVVEITASPSVWKNDTGWMNLLDECDWHGTICQNSTLIGLDLAENNLKGNIPLDLALLNNLSSLDLSYNSLSGPLPTEMFQELTMLKTLNLAENALTGTLSSYLGTLNELIYLDLSSNRGLTNSIPNEIEALNTLQTLRLQTTDLTGSIPLSLCNLEQVPEIQVDCGNVTCHCCVNPDCTATTTSTWVTVEMKLGLEPTYIGWSIVDLQDNTIRKVPSGTYTRPFETDYERVQLELGGEYIFRLESTAPPEQRIIGRLVLFLGNETNSDQILIYYPYTGTSFDIEEKVFTASEEGILETKH